jgi:methionine-rich copper-binding protein CopC
MLMKLGLALVVLVIGNSYVASAHAVLVKSNPAARSILRTSPQNVRAWFNEELDPKRSSLIILDSKGRRVGQGGVDLNDLDRKSMLVRIKRIGPGKYTVKWRAVSADDGFVAQGAFQFTLAW